MKSLKIDYRHPADLKPYARNARTHCKAQIAQIAKSIKAFGFNVPVLVNAEDELIAGHGRVLAAQSIGLSSIPVIYIDHLSEAERRAYILADNKIAQNSGWDENLLRIEMGELAIELEDLDLTITGFEAAEVDLILGYDGESGSSFDSDADVLGADEALDPDRSIPAITRLGDVWCLGPHTVMCEDSLDRENWDKIMGDDRAQMVFTDPPYNVPINGHVSGKGQHTHPEFDQASGEMSRDEFTAFLTGSLKAMAEVSSDGSLSYVCMDWRHLGELLEAGGAVYDAHKNICVWAKTNAGMGSLYRSRHEMVCVFKKGRAPHINNVQLGRFGRSRSNVWTYAGVNSFGSNRDADLADHPTVKPLPMVRDAILDVTHIGDIVIDGFLGSGTTLLAADACDRIVRGIEIDPYYVDVILRRYEARTGLKPILSETSERVSEVRVRRAQELPLEAGR